MYGDDPELPKKEEVKKIEKEVKREKKVENIVVKDEPKKDTKVHEEKTFKRGHKGWIDFSD